MASYSLTKQAEVDLENIYRFGLKQFGEHQADLYYFELITFFEDISFHPKLWINIPELGPKVRKAQFKSTTIYFEETGKDVLILELIGRQLPSYF